MKKNSLPKEFQGMLKELKRLDDELGISRRIFANKKERQECDRRDQRKKLLEKIWENWPRKTLLTKDVLQMRGNALKNSQIKTTLDRYKIRIEDCALIDCRNEQHIGSWHDCPANCSPEDIQANLIKWEFGNTWFAPHSYYWGGPKDRIKILFHVSGNNRFNAIGLTEMFPMKKAA
jgi:hypothetical protein